MMIWAQVTAGRMRITGSAFRWSVTWVNGMYPSHRAALLARSHSHFHSRSVFRYTEPPGLTCPMSM
jgi:hypothetical protein